MRRKHSIFATCALLAVGLNASMSDEPRFDLFGSADGDGAGGGGGAAPPPPAAAPPAVQAAAAPTAPAFDTEKAQAEARAAALKEMGFADEAAFKADQKKRKEEAAAKLSENERNALALKESLDARGAAEAAVEKHKAEAKSLRDQLAMRDRLDEQGVAPKERLIAETLFSHAKAQKDFDEKKFFDELRKERPYLFGAAAAVAPPAASTTATPPAGGSAFGGPPPTSGKPFNAMTATREELAAWDRANRH